MVHKFMIFDLRDEANVYLVDFSDIQGTFLIRKASFQIPIVKVKNSKEGEMGFSPSSLLIFFNKTKKKLIKSINHSLHSLTSSSTQFPSSSLIIAIMFLLLLLTIFKW